ncbi:MAG: outer membrane beta-barrel protein [Bradyrhizobium sp.]
MRYLVGVPLIVTGLAVAIGQASAADLPKAYTKAPPPPVVQSWTGFYIGGHVGGGVTDGDLRADYLSLIPPVVFGVNPTLAHSSASGFLGGVQGGYNWQFAPSWVAGIEGDFSWTRMNSSFTTFGTFTSGLPNTTQPTTWTRDLNWLASARARLGFLVTPSLLLYGTGGGAWGSLDYSGSFVNTAPGSNNWLNPFSSTRSGYVVGAGAEWMFAPHWLVRGEYLFYHLGGTSQQATNPAPFPAFPIQFTYGDTNTHVGRVAVSYKF